MKKVLLFLFAFCLVRIFCAVAAAENAADWAELTALISGEGNTVNITLFQDISVVRSDRTLMIPAGKWLCLT